MSESSNDVVGGLDATASIGEMTKNASTTLNTKANELASVFTSSKMDDIMQVICMILLGIVLVIVTPTNVAVMYMGKWWVRLLSLIFLLGVMYAEKDKPRVSILLGLVIVALIVFSDAQQYSESFYGRVPYPAQTPTEINESENSSLSENVNLENTMNNDNEEQTEVQPVSTNVEEQYASPF